MTSQAVMRARNSGLCNHRPKKYGKAGNKNNIKWPLSKVSALLFFVVLSERLRKVMKTIALFRIIAGVIRGLKALKVMTINPSLGPIYEFVCISFRTGDFNCFCVQ